MMDYKKKTFDRPFTIVSLDGNITKSPIIGLNLDTIMFYLPLLFQIWEKLILSKLNWDVNLVVANDYLTATTVRQLKGPML